MGTCEILFSLGGSDRELEPVTLTCSDRCTTPIFSFLPAVSSAPPNIIDHVPHNEQPNSQTGLVTNSPLASPTANILIINSIAFSAVYTESEDELLRPSKTSRRDVPPFVSRTQRTKSQHHVESVSRYKQHHRQHFVSRGRVFKTPPFNHLPDKLKLDISSEEISYWDCMRQDVTVKKQLFTLSTNCSALKSLYSSPTSMTLTPFAPPFCPQQCAKPYSFS